MKEGKMTRTVAALTCTAALLLAAAEARAVETAINGPDAKPAPVAKPKGGDSNKNEAGEAAKQGQAAAPEAGKPDAAKTEDTKSGEGEAAKPESPATEGPQTQPEGESGPLSLGELTKEGFVIRTTNFIPAEAVTRQSGKISSDAVIVTLQTSTATAVCFYTLKAYVGKKLNTIPACTVHR